MVGLLVSYLRGAEWALWWEEEILFQAEGAKYMAAFNGGGAG